MPSSKNNSMHRTTTGRSLDLSSRIESLLGVVDDLSERVYHLERQLAQRAAMASAKTTMELIIAAVADCYRLQSSDLIGRCRTTDLVVARHVAMALCMDARPSLAHICAAFKRDRGTVLYAIRSVNDRRETDKRFATEFENVQAHVLKAVADWQAGMARKEAA